MTLDNSWSIMNEEEMYDVNGGGSKIYTYTGWKAYSWIGVKAGLAVSNVIGAIAVISSLAVGTGGVSLGVVPYMLAAVGVNVSINVADVIAAIGLYANNGYIKVKYRTVWGVPCSTGTVLGVDQ